MFGNNKEIIYTSTLCVGVGRKGDYGYFGKVG